MAPLTCRMQLQIFMQNGKENTQVDTILPLHTNGETIPIDNYDIPVFFSDSEHASQIEIVVLFGEED